jgi:hypothetical protein
MHIGPEITNAQGIKYSSHVEHFSTHGAQDVNADHTKNG